MDFASKRENYLDISFIEDIINGMYDWVRVIDKDNNVLFLNEAMAEGIGSYTLGRKCYAILGKSAPCEALGGDFLDIFNIDEDHIGIYIADVSGHGVPASMLTIFLCSAIDKKSLSPSVTLEKLYRDFNDSNILNDLYITVFYAVIDLKKHEITFSNAGHNVIPILFNQNRFELLSSAGIPISDWLPNPQYQDKSLPLHAGDKLFLYTDGAVEIRNAQSEQFGEDRLLNTLLGNKASIDSTLEDILSQISRFVGNDQFRNSYDDITMALVELQSSS